MRFCFNCRLWKLLVIVMLFSACASTEKARYFNGMNENNYVLNVKNLTPVLQKGDILSITVRSLNPEASAVFNALPTNAINMTPAYAELSGYLIQPDGSIDFPVLGRLRAAGLEKNTLSNYIRDELLAKQLLVDPIVTIRILNFRVTVLGEVGKPGVMNITNEKVNVLEALGLAGDMTLFAKRDNVVLVREEDNKVITKRMNINSDEIFKSPYYYLKTNDILYVESNKAKVQSTSRATQLLPTILSALAFIAVIFDRYGR
ncbi:hypothetical protein OI18_11770 [Flavihumibacter solisilvae]|uniref:Uncharacterized protein n=2 Tax=Flavihumibacter solisilvae TaxID=1349421 RepID=A0A0C1L2U2_9BACT|nr:hypothetical protein OI18_11770 [Flavihumibacter solisilvae]